jgi:hypothetical protein
MLFLPTAGSFCNTTFAIAEGYIPLIVTGQNLSSPVMKLCASQCWRPDAHVKLRFFTATRNLLPLPGDGSCPTHEAYPLQRLTDPEPIPHDTDFASVISSDVPLCVQHKYLNKINYTNKYKI